MIQLLERNRYLKRIYFSRNELEQILILSCFFSIAMVSFRVFYTRELLFISLIWNLFLAYLPYAFSKWVFSNIQWIKNKWRLSFVFIPWLLFIPNSFYIITDLFHLKETEVVPLWFDLALIFSFAWNGLLLGIASVRHIEKIMEQQFRLQLNLLFVYPIMLLNAFGIYLGRYLRFNSWDVITNPFGLTRDIFDLCFHPVHYRFDWSMIFCFSVLMTLLYSTIKKISKAIS